MWCLRRLKQWFINNMIYVLYWIFGLRKFKIACIFQFQMKKRKLYTYHYGRNLLPEKNINFVCKLLNVLEKS